MNTEDTVAVFTVRSPQRVLREGGTQAWVLNPVRAKQCTWVVCVQNRNHKDHVFEEGTSPHATAFMVGRIASLRRSLEEDALERWYIAFSEYAMIDMPHVWKGRRNPVRYTLLADLGIDPATLSFQVLPPPQPVPLPEPPRPRIEAPVPPLVAAPTVPRGLTISEAKRGLASTFGLAEEAVEITIRG